MSASGRLQSLSRDRDRPGTDLAGYAKKLSNHIDPENMALSKPIELPFTRDSVIRVLTYGANPGTSPYSHKQIAEWCDRFWCQYLDIDAEPSIEELLPVLTDVETQWDLYLASTYSIEELRSRSFDNETMPVQWFRDWLKEVEK